MADEIMRRSWHCGFIDRAEWLENALPELLGESGVKVRELGICPGWLGRQDAVTEAWEAHAAMDKGELATFFPDADNALLDGAMAVLRAVNRFKESLFKKDPPG